VKVKGRIRADLDRPNEVLADLKVVGVFEKPDDYTTTLQAGAVKAIKEQH
jgi:hypothetical protein